MHPVGTKGLSYRTRFPFIAVHLSRKPKNSQVGKNERDRAPCFSLLSTIVNEKVGKRVLERKFTGVSHEEV